MPRKKDPTTAPDPTIYLKALALRDDPRVQDYRNVHYQLVLDSLQATGQRIASGERVPQLSDARRKSLLKQHASLSKAICKRYGIRGFGGGDPYLVKKKDWLANLRVSTDERLRIETNWETSFFSPVVRFHVLPKNAQVFPSESGTLYQLPHCRNAPSCPHLS